MNFKQLARHAVYKLPFLLYLVDFVRFIMAPREQISLWRDYFKTKRDAEFLHGGKFVLRKDKKALFVLASDMVYEIKIQAMLALGLKMAGWHVSFLMSKRCLWAKRYLRAFGFNDLVYWESVKLSNDEKKQCAADVKSFLSAEMTFQSVKKWMYRKALIGPQVISSVSRKMMQGAPNLKDPIVKQNIVALLPETIETVRSAEHLLDKIKPQLVSLIEANYTLMGALVDIAISRGISVTQTVQPSRDDAMIFKKLVAETRRIHPSAVSKESLDWFSNLPWTQKQESELQEELKNRYAGKWFLQSRNQPGVEEKNKEEIMQQLKLDPNKKIAVIFSPVLWDANLFYGEDLFEDFGDWFIQTVASACANPNVNWILKLHPANAWKRAREGVTAELSEIKLIREHIGELPDYVKLLYPTVKISTLSLFQMADYGLTVRGTIGMEMPCFGAPVFTAGTGRYSGLGFTIDSKNKEEYLAKLAKIHEYGRMSPEEILLAKRHAYCAFKIRPWVMRSFKSIFNYKKKGVHPLDSNLLFNAGSFEDIKNNKDLSKWADWIEDKNQIDYLDKDAIN